MSAARSGKEWWRSAVVYQVYPRSFADSDGDGMGDLPGVLSRLPDLVDLGIDAIWLSPFYRSPQKDAGYDVEDFRDVDPIFGTLEDAERLIAEAGKVGIRIMIDLVPNHTSDQHAWFRAAVAAAPGSRERARYVFRDGRGPGGAEPPNNWRSVFGGSAWTRLTEPDGTPGQWYLHLFDSSQPDLDWQNPEVMAETKSVIAFWMDRGAAGIRVDVAHSLIKADDLPDWHGAELRAPDEPWAEFHHEPGPMWDREEVHEIYREWRKVTDAYDGDRMFVAEAWVYPYSRLARYTRPDEMQQAFNFPYLETPWIAHAQRSMIDTSLRESGAVGAPVTWVLSNHDVVRHATRFGYPPGDRTAVGHDGISAAKPQPDRELGLRRARAATLMMLALPGSAYLYQGEELGLPEHTTLPDEARQDPTYFRTQGKAAGRDGCRVPIPWSGDSPSYGFGPSGKSWLPQPPEWAQLSREAQKGIPGSTLEMYRTALRLRRELDLGSGDSVEWAEGYDPATTVAFRRAVPGGHVLVVANLGHDLVLVPDGAEVVVSSADPVHTDAGPALGTDVTAWMRLPG